MKEKLAGNKNGHEYRKWAKGVGIGIGGPILAALLLASTPDSSASENEQSTGLDKSLSHRIVVSGLATDNDIRPEKTPVASSPTPKPTVVPTRTPTPYSEPSLPTSTPEPVNLPPVPTSFPTPIATSIPTPIAVQECNNARFLHPRSGDSVPSSVSVRAEVARNGSWGEECELREGVAVVLVDTYGNQFPWSLQCGPSYQYPAQRINNCSRDGVLLLDPAGAMWGMKLQMGDRITDQINVTIQ